MYLISFVFRELDGYLRSAMVLSKTSKMAKSLAILNVTVVYETEIAIVAVIIYNESMYSFGLSAM